MDECLLLLKTTSITVNQVTIHQSKCWKPASHLKYMQLAPSWHASLLRWSVILEMFANLTIVFQFGGFADHQAKWGLSINQLGTIGVSIVFSRLLKKTIVTDLTSWGTLLTGKRETAAKYRKLYWLSYFNILFWLSLNFPCFLILIKLRGWKRETSTRYIRYKYM